MRIEKFRKTRASPEFAERLGVSANPTKFQQHYPTKITALSHCEQNISVHESMDTRLRHEIRIKNRTFFSVWV